ncbi:hypothetical protein B9Z19DRAFT_1144653 [Tuber borchii]|uniref:Uncharacterized protein n=1 Tax=Tuber borchii TaxID=42251 RepID=A0A2T7A6R1_TUBBO|nr:hypothetical protein B9Z19DRAFT_1144653 [Tuber borchii]
MFSFKGRLPLVAHRSRFAYKSSVRRQFHQTSGHFTAEPSHPEAVQGSDHANDYLSTGHASTLHNSEQASSSKASSGPGVGKPVVHHGLGHGTKKLVDDLKTGGYFPLQVGLKLVSYDVSMQQKYDNNLFRVQDTIKADMKTMQEGLEKGQVRLEGELKSIAAKLEKVVGRGWF